MEKLLADPAIIAGVGVILVAIAALIQAKVAEVKADVAEKHSVSNEAKVDKVQEQTSDLHAKLAATTEQVNAIKEKV